MCQVVDCRVVGPRKERMGTQYSVEVCKQLEERFRAAEVHRPMRITRHEAGTELTYQVRSVGGKAEATVRLAMIR